MSWENYHSLLHCVYNCFTAIEKSSLFQTKFTLNREFRVLKKRWFSFYSTNLLARTKTTLEVLVCVYNPFSVHRTHSESDITNQSQSKAEALLTVDSSSYVESRIEPGSQDLNYKNFLESTSGEDYTQLITQYYELEEKRQSVIQQLQEAGYWNHHHEPQFHENYSHAPALPSCCISQYAAGISSVCPTSQGAY